MNEGFLFVISGPSAVGKSSVADAIFDSDKTIKKIVTCTTRKIRANEIDGIDYHFMSVDDFISHKNNNDFVEYSNVYDNYYGVLLSSVFEKIKNKEDSLLVINWEGFLKLKVVFPQNVCGFFLTPPTMEDLETRIKLRGMNSMEEISRRIDLAKEDMSHKNDFDFSFKNAEISETANNILSKINELRKTRDMKKIL